MGGAYLDLLSDPDLLQVQLHAFAAAAADPDIAAACRHSFDVIWHLVRHRTGLDDDAIRQFFAQGMLFCVISAIDLFGVGEPWALSFCPDPAKLEALPQRGRQLVHRRNLGARRRPRCGLLRLLHTPELTLRLRTRQSVGLAR